MARRERWLVVAATSRAAAEAYVAGSGIHCVGIVDRHDLLAAFGRVDRIARDLAADRVCLHSVDWRRQGLPQIYTASLALSRVHGVLLADESGDEQALTAGDLAVAALRAPFEFVTGGAASARELVRARRLRRPTSSPSESPRSVVAVWPGSLEGAVGGAVTHAAGILAAFHEQGMRTRLITAFEPPEQLAGIADEIRVAPPLRASSRSGPDLQRISLNVPIRGLVEDAIDELDSPLIYSRHQAFQFAPAELAGARGIPLVLEWNASERWALQHWTHRGPIGRRSLALVGAVERRVLEASTLVAAVSEPARKMAVESGAAADRTMTVPNGVDLGLINRVLGNARPSVPAGARTAGWIGTFGQWHGAEVIVEAAARTRSVDRFVMIGDGLTRAGCERRVDELGVRDRFEFTGRLSHPDALARLAVCDMLLSPHVPLPGGEEFFGSPTKIFEYMALSRPIVASDLGQIGEVLSDGVNALLIEPGSAGGLAAAIDVLAADPELAARLGRRAGRDARASHGWEQRVEAILAAVRGA